MPKRPLRFNTRPRPEARRAYDADRGSARARGYTHDWDKAAKAHLAEHPLCVYCAAGAFGPARVTVATVVDHLFPHRGDPLVFWRRAHWVSSCTPCHAGPKQAVEARGDAAIADLAHRLGRPKA